MHFSAIITVLAASTTVNGLNILISNDDGFGVALIREMYKAVKANGHNVYIVAATSDKSGTGGSISLPVTANLTADTQYGIVKAGAPSVGTDPNDSHIWYFNGTPSITVAAGLDYILPKYANFSVPDLVLSGPNYGNNVGGFAYTGSGTIGATYYSVGRGIPAIAFSGNGLATAPYTDVVSSTPIGLKDPATINGILAANLVEQLIKNSNGSRLLPYGYGLNVNIPTITSLTSTSCINPPFIHTRLTGGAYIYGLGYNSSTELFSYKVQPNATALSLCINGNCALPGETDIVNGCQSSVSIFSVDYDAPSPKLATCAGLTDVPASIRASLMPLVQYANSTNLVGGLNGASVAGTNGTVPSTTSTSISPSAVVTSGSNGISVANDLAALLAVTVLVATNFS